MTKVTIQEQDFDSQRSYESMVAAHPNAGAIVQFLGRVRDTHLVEDHPGEQSSQQMTEVTALVLSHYEGMTQQVIGSVCDEAMSRWNLLDIEVYHRVGTLSAGEQIVLVTVASEHRADAFSGCEFVMDALKTEAPFWKKEIRNEDGSESDEWLTMKAKDQARADRWKL